MKALRMLALILSALAVYQGLPQVAFLGLVASLLQVQTSMVVLSCTLIGINKTNCPKGRAGIAKMWVASCDAILDMTFDANKCITSFTMDTTAPQPYFTEFEWENDTAFFNQEKTRIGNQLNVAQTISFNEPIMNPDVRCALEALNDCCCLVAIIKDNSGFYHVAGITYNSTNGEWEFEDMQTGDGSGNTGADPTNDNNQYTETLAVNAGFYAPMYCGTEATIPTP